MKAGLCALLAGLLFGLGLSLSEMINPLKVLAFLDIFGHWDPSLAWVLFSATGVYAVGYRWIVRKPTPWFTESFQIPTRQSLDGKLLSGSAIFGIGWGLAGYCPGPAITSVFQGNSEMWWFLPSLVAGMYAHTFIFSQTNRKTT